MKDRLPLQEAESLALELMGILSPACERIEVAGSIRRRKPMVGDIELLMVPKFGHVSKPATDLFGEDTTEPVNLQRQLVESLRGTVLTDRLDVNGNAACGDRMQRMAFKGFAADLFIVLPPASWGVLMAIRTGPSDYSHRFMTARMFGGPMPDDMAVKHGSLYVGVKREQDAKGKWVAVGGEPVETPEEQDFFQRIGLPYLRPEDRK